MNETFAQFYITLLAFLLKGKQLLIAAGAKQGLTAMQVITLMLIDGESGSPMSILSTMLFCDASNVTGLIDGLEHKKLAIRTEKQGDRRVKIVKLTGQGLTMRKSILVEAGGDGGSVLLKNLTANERKTFATLLDKLSQDSPTITHQKESVQAEANA